MMCPDSNCSLCLPFFATACPPPSLGEPMLELPPFFLPSPR